MSQTEPKLGHSTLGDELRDAVNGDSDFNEQARWFDGTILLEMGDEQLWIKCYKGEIIDTMETLPPIGYTFKVTGSKSSWEQYLRGERQFGDLINYGEEIDPEIWTEGDLIEANRMHEATYLLVKHLKEVVNL